MSGFSDYSSDVQADDLDPVGRSPMCHPCRQCCGGRCSCCCSPNGKVVWSFVLLVFGILLVTFAVFLPTFVEHSLHTQIDQQILLTPTSQRKGRDGWKQWQDNSAANKDAIPLWFTVWMWDLQNPHEVLQGAKPVLKQVGPYAYRENKVRFNITFGTDENGFSTVRYHTWKYFTFDPSRSGAGLDPKADLVTSLNMPFQGAVSALWGKDDGVLDLLFGSPDSDFHRMFLEDKTVHEILWGYEILPGQNFDGALGPNMTTKDMAFKKMGYEEIYTGAGPGEGYLNRGYKAWNGMEYLEVDGKPLWGNGQANRIFGTEADNYARGLAKGQNLPTFVDTLYREITLMYQKKVTFRDIELYRHVLSPAELESQHENPQNVPYHMKYQGMLNGTGFQLGVPVTFCKANMLDVYPPLRENIVGMKPNRKLHDTFVDVEPITGVTMHAAKRLQGNVVLRGPIDLSYYNEITKQHVNKTWLPNMTTVGVQGTDVMMPLFWVEEGGQIDSSKADDFRHSVYVAMFFIDGFPWLGYFAGVVIILAALLFMVHLHRNASYAAAHLYGDDHDGLSVNSRLLENDGLGGSSP